MDKNIAKKLSEVAFEARRKADYLRMRPNDSSKWNYEQKQAGPEALEEIARKIELLVAGYFIQANLQNNKEMLAEISRQCRTAIRNHERKTQVWQEFAEI